MGLANDLDLALKAAERASSILNDEDPMILDTLARCYYELGQIDQAIKFQQLAVDNGQGNKTISTTLKKYLAEKAAVKEAAAGGGNSEEAAPEEAEGKKASD
jgi:tetratricopeptide (TPR) repeat protein